MNCAFWLNSEFVEACRRMGWKSKKKPEELLFKATFKVVDDLSGKSTYGVCSGVNSIACSVDWGDGSTTIFPNSEEMTEHLLSKTLNIGDTHIISCTGSEDPENAVVYLAYEDGDNVGCEPIYSIDSPKQPFLIVRTDGSGDISFVFLQASHSIPWLLGCIVGIGALNKDLMTLGIAYIYPESALDSADITTKRIVIGDGSSDVVNVDLHALSPDEIYYTNNTYATFTKPLQTNLFLFAIDLRKMTSTDLDMLLTNMLGTTDLSVANTYILYESDTLSDDHKEVITKHGQVEDNITILGPTFLTQCKTALPAIWELYLTELNYIIEE